MERWCRENSQCRGVLLIWIIVGQGPTALVVGAGGGCLDIFFSHLSFLFFFSLSLWEKARYRLKYCFKGPLSPKQPTNQHLKQTTRCNRRAPYVSILQLHSNVICKIMTFLENVDWNDGIMRRRIVGRLIRY